MEPIIALLSDLGSKDYFVGSMKGAILSINPDAKIVDITHEIPKRDVRSAAFTLLNAAQSFPKGSIFVVVVDPGVGTERRCLLLQSQNGLIFIAPDNGVLTLVSDRFGTNKIQELTNEELMRPQVSATFHGRDIMAPIAAHLSSGLDISAVGPTINEFNRLEYPEPELKHNKLFGKVIHIDDFGNLVTNIGASLLDDFASFGEKLVIKINNDRIKAQLAETFGKVGEGEILCYVGSAELLEIAKNRGNLAQDLGLDLEAEIILEKEVKGDLKE